MDSFDVPSEAIDPTDLLADIDWSSDLTKWLVCISECVVLGESCWRVNGLFLPLMNFLVDENTDQQHVIASLDEFSYQVQDAAGTNSMKDSFQNFQESLGLESASEQELLALLLAFRLRKNQSDDELADTAISLWKLKECRLEQVSAIGWALTYAASLIEEGIATSEVAVLIRDELNKVKGIIRETLDTHVQPILFAKHSWLGPALTTQKFPCVDRTPAGNEVIPVRGAPIAQQSCWPLLQGCGRDRWIHVALEFER